MARHRARDRAGFKLIELLVLILVIFVLVGLALPVINDGDGWQHGRMKECRNNMRNFAQALQMYEMTHRHYPGYSNVLLLDDGQSYVDPATGQKHGVSFVVPLLLYLDRPDLDRIWHSPNATPNKLSARVEVNMFTCPSDPPTLAGQAPLSYVVNCGMKDVDGTPATEAAPGVPRDWAANGVFFDLYTGNPLADGVKLKPGEVASKLSTIPEDRVAKFSDKFGIFAEKQPGLPLVGMSNEYISRHDGTAQTCLLSENVDAGEYTDYTEAKVGLVWDATGKLDLANDPPSLKPPDDDMRINVGTGNSDMHPSNGNTKYARPSSFHPHGCNMAFCDGKVRFVSDSMDYYVYCLLMSSNGSKVRLPGTDQVLPNYDRPLVETWYLQ